MISAILPSSPKRSLHLICFLKAASSLAWAQATCHLIITSLAFPLIAWVFASAVLRKPSASSKKYVARKPSLSAVITIPSLICRDYQNLLRNLILLSILVEIGRAHV